MHLSDRTLPEIEFPTRYAVDEARFCAGQAKIRNEKEVVPDEQTTRNA